MVKNLKCQKEAGNSYGYDFGNGYTICVKVSNVIL